MTRSFPSGSALSVPTSESRSSSLDGSLRTRPPTRVGRSRGLASSSLTTEYVGALLLLSDDQSCTKQYLSLLLQYAGHKDALFDEVTAWFKSMGEDPVNVRFGEDWKKLTKDVLFDEHGSLTFKPDLWNDIRQEILPTLVGAVGYIPIPRIEYTDKQIDLVIENLVLQGGELSWSFCLFQCCCVHWLDVSVADMVCFHPSANLFPNIVSLEANNFFKFSPYSNIKDESHHRFTLKLSQIQADMRDVG